MEAFQISSDEGRRVMLETTVERPAMLPWARPTASWIEERNHAQGDDRLGRLAGT